MGDAVPALPVAMGGSQLMTVVSRRSPPSPSRVQGGAEALQPAAYPSRSGDVGTRAGFGGGSSQPPQLVACCLTVEIGAVLAGDQASQIPVVHGTPDPGRAAKT